MNKLNEKQKKRLFSTVWPIAILLGIGLIYLLSVMLPIKNGEPLWNGIPCIFYKGSEHFFKHVLHIEREGLKCAGCGLSRMLISIVKLDFTSAFRYNPFLFITGPLLIAYFTVDNVKYIITGKQDMGKWKIFLYVECALTVAYMVLRNIFPI